MALNVLTYYSSIKYFKTDSLTVVLSMCQLNSAHHDLDKDLSRFYSVESNGINCADRRGNEIDSFYVTI